MSGNPFVLAADYNPALLPLLQENPATAKSQDEYGYSLVHAAASYNHLDLLRKLICDFDVDINIKDEDDETALFVVETVEAAKALVDLGVDVDHRGLEGLTAREKIEIEADFPDVAAYLSTLGSSSSAERAAASTASASATEPAGVVPPRPPPEGMKVTYGTMTPDEAGELDVDPEFRRRIEEFAQRDDFDTPEGQADLRKLVEDAITDQGLGGERNVRSKQH